MINEAWLQFLLILAYLAIGLISVTFPIYAICVTYLRQEKWETEKEQKERIKKLKENIAKLTKELSGEEKDTERFAKIKEQVEKYEEELEGLNLRVEHLTAKGAVGKPVVSLVVALVASGIGVFLFYDTYAPVEYQVNLILGCGGISVLCIIFALYGLYKTISAVEYAALRPARTIDFTVAFREQERLKETMQMKLGKSSQLCIGAATEEDHIENFRMIATIPPELEVMEEPEDIVLSRFRDCTVALIKEVFLPKDLEIGLAFEVKPNKVGIYPVEVTVCGKGIHDFSKVLVIQVEK